MRPLPSCVLPEATGACWEERVGSGGLAFFDAATGEKTLVACDFPLLPCQCCQWPVGLGRLEYDLGKPPPMVIGGGGEQFRTGQGEHVVQGSHADRVLLRIKGALLDVSRKF